jgi:hypothetical protein
MKKIDDRLLWLYIRNYVLLQQILDNMKFRGDRYEYIGSMNTVEHAKELSSLLQDHLFENSRKQ